MISYSIKHDFVFSALSLLSYPSHQVKCNLLSEARAPQNHQFFLQASIKLDET